jgi:hypothetical protein
MIFIPESARSTFFDHDVIECILGDGARAADTAIILGDFHVAKDILRGLFPPSTTPRVINCCIFARFVMMHEAGDDLFKFGSMSDFFATVAGSVFTKFALSFSYYTERGDRHVVLSLGGMPEAPVTEVLVGYEARSRPDEWTEPGDARHVRIATREEVMEAGDAWEDLFPFQAASFGIRKITGIPLPLVLELRQALEREEDLAEVMATLGMFPSELVASSWEPPDNVEVFQIKRSEIGLLFDDHVSARMREAVKEQDDTWGDDLLEVVGLEDDDIDPDVARRVRSAVEEETRKLAGWYFWFCQPGCLPDSEPDGPYPTEQKAIEAAWDLSE